MRYFKLFSLYLDVSSGFVSSTVFRIFKIFVEFSKISIYTYSFYQTYIQS